MIFAALLFAAIMTQQNDLYTRTADYATFSSNSTGIASCWIPYGTYTAGAGETEYLRVTSNLIGVVASVFDGYVERDLVRNEYLPEDVGNLRFIFYPPPQFTNRFTFTDHGEYLRTTNNTLRLVDFFSRSRFLYCRRGETTYSYEVGDYSDTPEERIAKTDEGPDYFYNAGLAADFGSRHLDALVEGIGGIAPPIATTWSASLPFDVADLSSWTTCWPTYSALTNDIHFYPIASTDTWHSCSRPFMDWTEPFHIAGVWGSDVNTSAWHLVTNTLPVALPFDMEDVLSVDTGWKYEFPPVVTSDWWTVSGPLGNFRLGDLEEHGDYKFWSNQSQSPTNYYTDMIYYPGEPGTYGFTIIDVPTGEILYRSYTEGDDDAESLHFGPYYAERTRLIANQDDYKHWRNGTKRLDWKRIGIVCQLERQMEQTYLPRDDEDYLPFLKTNAERDHLYSGFKSVSMLDPSGGIVATTNFNASDVNFTLYTQLVSTVTTNIGWCFPTARLAYCIDIGGIAGGSQVGNAVYTDASDLKILFEHIGDMLAYNNSLSNGELTVELYGYFGAQGLSGFVWDWQPIYAAFDSWDDPGNPHDVPISTSGQMFFPAGVYFPSNVIIDLSMQVGKRAMSLQTDGEAMDETVENLVHYPKTNIWDRGWVAEQCRPSLEVMIDAKGHEFDTYAATDDNSAMSWDDIKSVTNKVRRVFRMNPHSGAQTTMYQSDYNRWRQLWSLDSEVKARFRSITGLDIASAAENLVDFVAGEEQAIKNLLINEELQLFATLGPTHTNGFVCLDARAHISIDAGGNASFGDIVGMYWDGGGVYMEEIPEIAGEYLLGSYGLSYSGVALTNQVINVLPVRVDGHQDQMVKTLWRFKNLRDPNL